MKAEQYIQLKNELDERGYRCQDYAISSDASHAFYKPFGKYSNPYDDEGRSCYQVFYEVYDYRPFAPRAATDYGIEVRLAVSRTSNDRVDLILPYEGQPISYFENLADSFYEWVDKNIKIEP